MTVRGMFLRKMSNETGFDISIHFLSDSLDFLSYKQYNLRIIVKG